MNADNNNKAYFRYGNSKTSPLCYLPNGKLVCYKYGYLFIYEDGRIISKHRVFSSIKETLLAISKVITRGLRLGVRSAIALDNEEVILSVSNTLYEYNFRRKELSNGYCFDERIRPLNFTEIKGINGFDDGIIFGGYLVNFDKKPVHIYKRIRKDEWRIIYTFSQGEINHIHNIIPDPYRNCLWVLTGDFENSSSIWKVTNNFNTVEKVLSGQQTYRGCVGFPIPEGLLYATDTPFSSNNIILLKNDGTIKEVQHLPGSCIYGCKWKDKYIFSTAVEPDSSQGPSKNLVHRFIKSKRGPGIDNEYAHIFLGAPETGWKDIFQLKKDIFSYLFQLAVFKFPTGNNNGDILWFQPMSTTRYDLTMIGINNSINLSDNIQQQ